MNPRHLYLVCYDIPDDRRRHRIHALARGHASDGQRSAYECWLTPATRQCLLRDITAQLHADTDRFALVRLDPRQTPVSLGLGKVATPIDCWVIG